MDCLDVCYPSQFGFSEARPQGLRMSRIPATSQDGCHLLPEFGGFRLGRLLLALVVVRLGFGGSGVWVLDESTAVVFASVSRLSWRSVVFFLILCPLILVGIRYRLRPTGK